MKIFKLWGIQLLASLAMIVTGCSSSSDENETIVPDKPSEEKFIQVPIGFCGEITNITESPLSRAEDAKDWYVFQVYSMPEDGNGRYQYYAYGFFDNKENMIINLKEGYKYKFDVCMVVEGSKKVNKFYLSNAGWSSIGNSFLSLPRNM